MTYHARHQAAPAMERRDCEFCDAKGCVVASMEIERFPYGAGDDAVTLEARVPVWTCAECEEVFTGEEAEEIRHATVCHHLNRPAPRELQEFRQVRKLTQAQFAALTNFGIASIKRWESGSQIPSASAAQALRNAMGVTPSRAHLEPQFRTHFSASTLQRAITFRPGFCSVLPELRAA